MEEEQQKLLDTLKEAPSISKEELLKLSDPFTPQEKPVKRYKKMPKAEELLNFIDLPPAPETPIVITEAKSDKLEVTPVDTQKELLIEGAKKVLDHYRSKHKINSIADYKSPGLLELAQALEQ